jgi:hypothetical protein
MDSIITDPALCSWNPETLLCGPGDNATSCLTSDQVDGLKKLYRAVLGTNEEVVAPGFDPGEEGDLSSQVPMNGVVSIPSVVRGIYLITEPEY